MSLGLIMSSDVSPFLQPQKLFPARSIPQTPPSKSEIVCAIKSIPSGKTAGIDGIPAEFYKSNPYIATKVLQPILEEAWLSEAFSEESTDDIIIEITKTYNLKIFDNWHGICILPAIVKIITKAKVILDRIKDHLYSTIDREQAGFRPGSSCVQHINMLRIISEQNTELNTVLSEI